MTATTRKYRTPHTSERAFTVKNNCRLVVLAGARAHETNGESYTRRDGKPYTHSGRMALISVLRRNAAEKRGEPALAAKGFNRSEALYAYAKTFPTGMAVEADLTVAEMRARSADGWFISVSGSMSRVPGSSKLDDYVSDYPHEIGILPFSDENAEVLEPMRPRGAGTVTVPWSDVAKFSAEFATSGRRLCIIVKAGRDTAAARKRREYEDDLDEADRTVARVRTARDEALAAATDLADEVDDLTRQLTECRNDCGDGATEALLDDLETWIKERRP